MKYWQEGIYSWGHFITILIVLIGIYFLLKLIIRIGINVGVLGKTQERIVGFLGDILIVFEPIALVVLLGIFVMISPMYHGTILALILLSGISQIRNYFAGRMILLNKSITIGSPIKSGEMKGTIIKMDRLGMRIRTLEGVYFVNYQNLQGEGYLISNLGQIGGIYLMSITDNREDPKKGMQNELYHILRASPFIEPERKIKIDINSEKSIATVGLAIRNNDHVDELLAHLNDRGFSAHIIND